MGIFVGVYAVFNPNDQGDVLSREAITAPDKGMLLSVRFLVGLGSSLPFGNG